MNRYAVGTQMVKPCTKARYVRCSLLIFSVGLVGWLSAAPAPSSSHAPQANRMDAITALGLESMPGSMPVFYSPHAKLRAKFLQDLLGGEIGYYEQQFRVPLGPVTLAVLDSSQWPAVAPEEPFGMPSVEGTRPAVVVMPASWDEVQWMVVPKRAEVPRILLHNALANGRKWAQVKFEGCDGIGTHEVGHYIVRALGIDP
jgi:hypothetical protein